MTQLSQDATMCRFKGLPQRGLYLHKFWGSWFTERYNEAINHIVPGRDNTFERIHLLFVVCTGSKREVNSAQNVTLDNASAPYHTAPAEGSDDKMGLESRSTNAIDNFGELGVTS